ncbi:MAG: recombinase family protein [Nanoarchaeota archaeon]|nr:recombinase family protein [Nanoarchaeota archaeon]
MNELETLKKENKELKEEIEKLKLYKNRQKKGMVEKAKEGNPVSRAPFGYKFFEGKLTKAQNFQVVENIFLDFQNNKISLNKLSKKYGFSLNGVKKILRNFTYLGKIKFDGDVHSGTHEPLISSTLFNHVQDKLERLGIKQN